MALLSRVWKGIQLAMVCYTAWAVFCTTWFIWQLGIGDGLSNSTSGKADAIAWTSSKLAVQHTVTPAATTEALFLSKAFSQSMQPNRIIPFFYKATGNFDREDITITTLITSNRFKVFSQLVAQNPGPISVAIHVKNMTKHVQTLLDDLHELYISTPHMSTNVDVHLIIDSFDRQFNTWRNIARLFAPTDFVMMLDVDFAICTDFRKAIRSSSVVMEKLREGNAAFVIPAFEYTRHTDGVDRSQFPRNKETLLSLVRSKRIDMFHTSWLGGHNSTDYPRYYTAQPGEIYRVARYQAAYEPHVIFKKEGPPWCDERLVGYGGNKAACLFEMYLSGISFYVLADHFLVHQSHLYEEATRKIEVVLLHVMSFSELRIYLGGQRKYNRKVFTDFKEEICLRYLKTYYDHGLLNTTRAYNALEECGKVKGVKKLAAQLFG